MPSLSPALSTAAPNGHRLLIATLVVLAALLPPSRGAMAQAPVDQDSASVDQAQATVDEVQATATFDSTFAIVQHLDSTIATIDAWLVGRIGEDSLVLASRKNVRLDERLEGVWELNTLVPNLPADGFRVAASDSLLIDEASRLRSRARDLVNQTLALRSDRAALSPVEDLARERRLGRLDQALIAALERYDETTQRMAARGMDTAEQAAALDGALSILAEALAGRMELAEQDVEDLRARPSGSGGEDATVEVAALQLRIRQTAAVLESVLTMMDERGLTTDEYRSYLVISTGDLSSGNLSVGVVRTLVESWWSHAVEWTTRNGANILVKILLFLGILAAFRGLAGLAKKVLVATLDKSGFQVSQLLKETLVRWTGRGIMILGLIIALGQLGLDLAPLLAGLGVAGFIVGFALQDTLSNFAAGIMILLYRPFDTGDMVETGSVFGKVDDMSLVSTTILSIDNQRFVVPNSQIWGNVIKNVTAQDIRRVDLRFGIGYESDIPTAEGVLARIVKDHPLVLADPEPVIKLHALGDSSVDFVVRPWCRTADYWDVHWDVTREVKLEFDGAGISIPFPQRDVHLFTEADTPAPDPSDPST